VRVRACGIAVVAAAALLAACAPTDASSPSDRTEESVEQAEPSSGSDPSPDLPPPGLGLDYQLGGDSPLPDGVGIVVRDWFEGEAADGAYSVCYVNAFQTQADDDRPDGTDSWPPEVVWRDGGEDPEWPGEYPVDLGTADERDAAAAFVATAIDTCAEKGFDAVELDNLDTFTRWPDAPFDRDDTIAYATELAALAHDAGLAVAQKNTVELLDAGPAIGFDLAVVEECGTHDECAPFLQAYGDAVLIVEYTDGGLAAACAATAGTGAHVVRRDLDLVTPDDADYLRETC
jgi:hypothetical protein